MPRPSLPVCTSCKWPPYAVSSESFSLGLKGLDAIQHALNGRSSGMFSANIDLGVVLLCLSRASKIRSCETSSTCDTRWCFTERRSTLPTRVRNNPRHFATLRDHLRQSFCFLWLQSSVFVIHRHIFVTFTVHAPHTCSSIAFLSVFITVGYSRSRMFLNRYLTESLKVSQLVRLSW